MYSFILPTSRLRGNNPKSEQNAQVNILSLTVNKQVGCSVSSLHWYLLSAASSYFSPFFHFSFLCSFLPRRLHCFIRFMLSCMSRILLRLKGRAQEDGKESQTIPQGTEPQPPLPAVFAAAGFTLSQAASQRFWFCASSQV